MEKAKQETVLNGRFEPIVFFLTSFSVLVKVDYAQFK